MKIRYIKQLSENDIKNQKFDLVIAASGYEKRANYISKLIHHSCKEKIVFSFSNYKKEITRVENDHFFNKNNFKSYELTGNEQTKIIEILNEFIENNKSESISILIDYSSMTRIWYGSIIKYMRQLNIGGRIIKMFFSYSASKFQKPNDKDSKTTNFEPINGFCSLSVPSFPTALITGLGYERNKAFGLKEFFDAELLYLFYTKDNEYTEHVLQINQELIKRTPKANILPYNVNDLLLTKTILYELCLSLKDNYRIIIAPLGPKPFTLISFLIADELQQIDVWRISSDDFSYHKLCEPNGKVFTLELYYE